MPNSWDLVPASLWPLQPRTPQADPGQGAGYVPPRSGPAAWPSFILDYASPEAVVSGRMSVRRRRTPFRPTMLRPMIEPM